MSILKVLKSIFRSEEKPRAPSGTQWEPETEEEDLVVSSNPRLQGVDLARPEGKTVYTASDAVKEQWEEFAELHSDRKIEITKL